MKKFSRCILILIFVAIVSGVGSYFYEDHKIKPVYESVAKLYVVPGEAFEASIRSKDGGLNDDFTIIFTGDSVISTAKELAGTSEDIGKYITVSSPANSNIVEIKCVNPSQSTAKTYVDAVAQAAIQTTIIPVESIKIFSEGTSTDKAIKPDLYRNTLAITLLCTGACLLIEIIVVLFLSAFKKKDDNEAEYEYERRFGKYAYIEEIKKELLEDSEFKRASGLNRSRSSNDDDILDDDDLYSDTAAQEKTPSKQGESKKVDASSEPTYSSPSNVASSVAGTAATVAASTVSGVAGAAATVAGAAATATDGTAKAATTSAYGSYSYITHDDDKKDEGPRYSAYGAIIDDGRGSSKKEEPVDETPVVEKPAAEEPAVEEPAPASVVEEPVVEEPAPAPVVEEPAVEEPAVEEPVVEEPAVEEPAPASVVEEPAVEEPAVEEPVVEEPAVEEPVPASVVEEPVVEEPAVEEPAPAPVVEESSADESVEESGVEESVVETEESTETATEEAAIAEEKQKMVKIIGRICK